MTPFVVLALPRTRSFWLSHFLSYGGWYCGHDEIRHCRSLDDMRSWLAMPQVGAVETAAAPFWRLLPQLAPDARLVTLRRPIPEVVDSLAGAGISFDPRVMTRLMERHQRKLDQIERRLPNVLAVSFAELANEATCARVFEHCLPYPHDHAWWERASAANLQVDLPRIVAYYQAHAPQVEKLRLAARHEILRRFRRSPELEGVTFQREELARFFTDRDAQRLMAEHCVQMGEQPEAWRETNFPLLERIHSCGNLHIYTGRSNGRMFGYLITAVGESYFAREQWEADELSFFSDPAWPGLGRKLQHAALDDLRKRGITRALMVEQDGSRIGTLYRRLGARQTGRRYVLELK